MSLQINWSWVRKQLEMRQRDVMIFFLRSSQVGPIVSLATVTLFAIPVATSDFAFLSSRADFARPLPAPWGSWHTEQTICGPSSQQSEIKGSSLKLCFSMSFYFFWSTHFSFPHGSCKGSRCYLNFTITTGFVFAKKGIYYKHN